MKQAILNTLLYGFYAYMCVLLFAGTAYSLNQYLYDGELALMDSSLLAIAAITVLAGLVFIAIRVFVTSFPKETRPATWTSIKSVGNGLLKLLMMLAALVTAAGIILLLFATLGPIGVVLLLILAVLMFIARTLYNRFG